MANEQNLKPPFNEWDSPSLVRELNAKGGRAAGETKRKKAAMRDIISALMGYRSELTKAEMERYRGMGLDADDINNQTKALLIQVKKATKGNLNALIFLRDTIGEKPIDNMNLNMTPPVIIDDVHE
jgi:hypothetical protein